MQRDIHQYAHKHELKREIAELEEEEEQLLNGNAAGEAASARGPRRR